MNEHEFLKPRLDEIRLLKDGWLEGSGKAPSRAGLDWLEEAFSLHYPDESVPPYLYPTPEGDIRAEWSNNRLELSMDIQIAKKRARWHALELETDDEENRDLNLGEDAGWAWLVGTVQLEKKSKRLTVAATDRGWQYQADENP